MYAVKEICPDKALIAMFVCVCVCECRAWIHCPCISVATYTSWHHLHHKRQDKQWTLVIVNALGSCLLLRLLLLGLLSISDLSAITSGLRQWIPTLIWKFLYVIFLFVCFPH